MLEKAVLWKVEGVGEGVDGEGCKLFLMAVLQTVEAGT